mmetsp:Transcript_6461/g.19600  ORF Transcript_6461/g.19600 Transcript_6461/m.19600 type:complete len:250 (+) Transcript_6461:139-888(+)
MLRSLFVLPFGLSSAVSRGVAMGIRSATSMRSAANAAAAPVAEQEQKLAGIIFDLDGCLTKQGAIDFKEMRRRARIPHKADILGHIASLPLPEGREAMRAVMEVEAEGISRMEARDGLDELFDLLDGLKMRRALLTRNTHHALEHFRKLSGKRFDEALDRTFEPPKPSPAALIEICRRWEVDPRDVVMVGDHSDDIECGRRAGSRTIQIVDEVVHGDELRYTELTKPHHTVQSLYELRQLIEEMALVGT